MDDDDYDGLVNFNWFASRRGYAIRWATKAERAAGNPKVIRMHNQIFRAFNRKFVVDHRDRNPLNNRKDNLRLATAVQNARNRSGCNELGIKGVSRCGKKFKAQINYHGQTVYLGLFDTPEEAHDRYRREADALFGEFTCFYARRREDVCSLERQRVKANPMLGTRPRTGRTVKGVYWDSSRSKWLALITIRRRARNLGRFESLQAAAKAYDDAASKEGRTWLNRDHGVY